MGECTLRRVPRGASDTAEANAFIFVIPGIDDPLVEEWSVACHEPLVNDIISRAPSNLRIHVLVAEHGLTSENLKSWDQLFIQAKALLGKIEDFRLRSDNKDKPVAFVCHSLGGVILKRLLVLAHQKDDRSKSLFGALTAISFLGTPHLRSDNTSKWHHVVAILTTRMKSPPEALVQNEASRSLIELSEAFQDLTLSVPVLSVNELKESRLKRSSTWSRRSATEKLVIIDSSLCKTGLLNEVIEAVESDHLGLCALDERVSFRHTLTKFLHHNLLQAHQKLHPAEASNGSMEPEPAQTATDSRHAAGQETTSNNAALSDSISQHTQTSGQSQRREPYVPGRWKYMDTQRELRLPCYMLDSTVSVKDFFGREDVLRAIHRTLVVPDGLELMPELKTFAIYGIGGIGKTSIASHFVQTRKESYDAVFWLNADTAGKLDDSFGKMALKLNLQEPGDDRDKVSSRNLVLDWLANPVKSYKHTSNQVQSKARWLLVFDNVDDFRLMEGFWPPSGAGSVLITSRDPLAELCAEYYSDPEQVKSTTTIQLRPFSDAEATDFLHKITQRNNMTRDEKAARDVARRVQGLPLALRQLAGIMTRSRLSFDGLFKLYDDERHHKNLFKKRFDVRNDDCPYNIATVWALEKLESGSRMLMNVLSFFDPDHIQEEILREGAPQVHAADYPKNNYEYTEARTGLWKSSLVNMEQDLRRQTENLAASEVPDDTTSQNIHERIAAIGLDPSLEPEAEKAEAALPELSVHRVVQDAARAGMDANQLHEAFEAAIGLLLARWRRKERLWHYDREDWPRADHLYPHVIQVHGHYNKMTTEHQKMLASGDLVRLLNCAGWYDHERGRSEESKAIFSTAFQICKDHLKLEDELMLEIHTSLGCIATEINDPKTCFEHYALLLDMTKKKYAQPQKEEDFDALMVANNEMGIAHMMMGHIHDSYDLFENARRMAHIHIHASETAKSIFLLASANLGLAQWLDGQLEAALETLDQAWNHHLARVEAGEVSSFAPGRIAHAIGNVKESQDLEDPDGAKGCALEWYKQAYDHYHHTIGLYHHRTADVCHKLAGQYIKLRDFENAHLNTDHAVEVFKSRTHYKPELARSLNLRSILLRAEDRTEEATKTFETAKVMYAEHMKKTRKERFMNKNPREADFDKIVTFWSR